MRGGALLANDDAKQGCNTGVTNERYFSHFARSYPCPMDQNWCAQRRRHSALRSWLACMGESTIMSNGLRITLVAATTLLAAATSVVHAGDYSAIAQAGPSARSVQGSVQASQPSMPAEHLGQESSLSGTPAPSVGNLPL